MIHAFNRFYEWFFNMFVGNPRDDTFYDVWIWVLRVTVVITALAGISGFCIGFVWGEIAGGNFGEWKKCVLCVDE